MARALALLALLVPLAACTPPAVIPDAERERVRRELDGERRYLRVAAWAGPLWGDHTRVLLTDLRPGELDLVLRPDGSAILPPPAERVVPPGTAVRVREVEFPTGWTIARRVTVTPRYHPWVYLEVPGDPRPHVIVLSQTTATYDDVRAELDRMLSRDDPSPALAALPQEQRAAILRKELVEGMSARAVELSWGFPERKRIDRPAGTEEWTWFGGKRRVFLQDDRLVRWEG
jgi:hypothetical protein